MTKKHKAGKLPPGFLAVSRKIYHHEFWKEPREFSRHEAWEDFRQAARFEENPGPYWTPYGIIQLRRGELAAAVRHLMEKWAWSMGKVTRFLNYLETREMIYRRQECGQTVVGLINYSLYNGGAETQPGTLFPDYPEKTDTSTGTPPGAPETPTAEGLPVIPEHVPEHVPEHLRNTGGYNNIKEGYKEGIKEGKELDGDGAPPPPPDPKKESYVRFSAWLAENAPTVLKLKKPFTLDEYSRIASEFKRDLIEQVLLAMENCNDLLKKYKSANLTFRNWAEVRLSNPDRTRKPASKPDGTAAAIKAAQQNQDYKI